MVSVLLVGATGLVGQTLLNQLIAEPAIKRIYAPTRQALAPHSKLDNRQGEDLRPLLDSLSEPVDLAFCCLGTTRQQAGNKNVYHFVDYVLPLYTGLVALHLQARHYVVMSALGANARSSFFYPRMKGELEQALQAQRWPQLTVVRPSMLIGERKTPRLSEKLYAPLFAHLPAKWRSIEAETVAKAMWRATRLPAQEGIRIIPSEQLCRLAQEEQNKLPT